MSQGSSISLPLRYLIRQPYKPHVNSSSSSIIIQTFLEHLSCHQQIITDTTPSKQHHYPTHTRPRRRTSFNIPHHSSGTNLQPKKRPLHHLFFPTQTRPRLSQRCRAPTTATATMQPPPDPGHRHRPSPHFTIQLIKLKSSNRLPWVHHNVCPSLRTQGPLKSLFNHRESRCRIRADSG